MNPFDNNSNNDDDHNNGMPPGTLLPPNYAVVSNPETGAIRIGKVGFSFTSLLFSFWPSVFRGDFYNTFCMLGVELIGAMFVTLMFGTPILKSAQQVQAVFCILWGFIYNMMYFRHLQNRGFKPVDERSKELLYQNHYYKK